MLLASFRDDSTHDNLAFLALSHPPATETLVYFCTETPRSLGPLQTPTGVNVLWEHATRG